MLTHIVTNCCHATRLLSWLDRKDLREFCCWSTNQPFTYKALWFPSLEQASGASPILVSDQTTEFQGAWKGKMGPGKSKQKHKCFATKIHRQTYNIDIYVYEEIILLYIDMCIKIWVYIYMYTCALFPMHGGHTHTYIHSPPWIFDPVVKWRFGGVGWDVRWLRYMSTKQVLIPMISVVLRGNMGSTAAIRTRGRVFVGSIV